MLATLNFEDVLLAADGCWLATASVSEDMAGCCMPMLLHVSLAADGCCMPRWLLAGRLLLMAAGWLLHDQHDGLLFAAACGAEENANYVPLCYVAGYRSVLKVFVKCFCV